MSENPRGGYQKHGHPAETVGLAAVAALGLEAVLPAAGVPGWVLPASEIIATWGAALVTWSFTGRKMFPLYLAGLGSFLGGWTAWAGSHGMWHGSTFGVWLAGLAVLVPWGVASWNRRHASEQPPAFPAAVEAVPEVLMLTPQPTEEEVQRELFAQMFLDFGISAGADPFSGEKIPVDVYSLTEDKAGRTVRVRLPAGGQLTIDDFRSRARNFEVALRAQEGAVMFDAGENSSDVVMKVRERDGFAQTALLTPDLISRTANDPIIIGIQEDGSPGTMTVREIHAMIVGTTGSGKSNLLNVLIAQLGACVDTVIWAIDMKGGRAIKPWFQAWTEGRADMPVIDWLATTREEAQLMMEALLSAAYTRMNSGIGGSKIKPSAGRPQIILITDEMADLFGDSRGMRSDVGEDAKTNTWFIKKGDEITQKGRSEAITTIWASQRGTTGMGASTNMKANINVRIALKPSQDSELHWIVPDLPNFAKRQLAYLAQTPGVGLIGTGHKASQPTKFFWHDHIEDVCGADENDPKCPPQCPVYQSELSTGPVRPRLDQMTAAGLGTAYSQRWVRAQQGGVIKVPARALSGGSAAYGYSDGGSTGDFDEIVKGIEDPDAGLPPARVRARNWLISRGVVGGSINQVRDMLAEEFGDTAPVRETVHRWFAEDRDKGLIHHPSNRRWVAGDGPNMNGED